MRSDAEIRIARRAADRLAGEIDPTLPVQVEQILALDPLEQRQERPFDLISIGGLIVSLVALGWTIYRDIKKDREEAQKKTTTQRLADQLWEEAEANGWLSRLPPKKQKLITLGVAQAIVDEL